MAASIVVTVRHPDYENEYETFGEPIIGVDIDLGSSFDVTRLSERDWVDVLDWACAIYDEADEVADGNGNAGEEAAAHIKGIAEETLALCLPYGTGHCNVEPFIRRQRRLKKWGMA